MKSTRFLLFCAHRLLFFSSYHHRFWGPIERGAQGAHHKRFLSTIQAFCSVYRLFSLLETFSACASIIVSSNSPFTHSLTPQSPPHFPFASITHPITPRFTRHIHSYSHIHLLIRNITHLIDQSTSKACMSGFIKSSRLL